MSKQESSSPVSFHSLRAPRSKSSSTGEIPRGGKEGKNAQKKNKEFLAREKKKKTRKSEQKKRRAGLRSPRPATEAPNAGPAEKQPRERCRVGPGRSAGETAGKQPEKHPKRAKQLFFGCLAAQPAVFRLFSWHFARGPLGTFFGCFSAVFKLRRSGPL